MESIYITVKEASEILGTNPRQIKRMCEAGRLRCKNINASANKRKIWRVSREDLTRPDKI
jgi:hypothetical protein